MLLNECITRCLDRTYPVFGDEMVVSEALTRMQEGRIVCAPVLHEGKVQAMVTILDLLAAKSSKKTAALTLRELELQPAETVSPSDHLFEVMARAGTFSCPVIAVAEEDGSYCGVLNKARVLEEVAGVFHLNDDGLTLELDVPTFGLKLSEVVAALEKNDAMVLSFGMYHPEPESERMLLTFRVQSHDQFRLIKNMEKYGYSIRYTSSLSKAGEDELREKALEFLRFMDM